MAPIVNYDKQDGEDEDKAMQNAVQARVNQFEKMSMPHNQKSSFW